jgi:hypothetical protein
LVEPNASWHVGHTGLLKKKHFFNNFFIYYKERNNFFIYYKERNKTKLGSKQQKEKQKPYIQKGKGH